MFIFDFFSKLFLDVLFFSGYISNNNVFPPPLSAEDEQKYLLLLDNGDKKARQILIEHNLRLVAHIAKKYSNDENNTEDFISIGTIGLIKGIDTYNTDKKFKLSPYISRCIENEILMWLRSNKKRQNDVSLDESIGIDKEGNSLTLADILPCDTPDVADEIWCKIEAGKLYSAIKSTLSPTEIYILSERYGLNRKKRKTQREIAAQLGISRSYVSRIEKKCLSKLYSEIKNRGL